MYFLKDISVIIPTLDRVQDLKETIESFENKILELKEVIIIDQSKNDKIRKFVKNLKNKKIKYIYQKTPSLTKARNKGISKSVKSSKLIYLIDDDVTLGENYFENILKVFNENPRAMAVGAFVPHPEDFEVGKIDKLLRRIFLIQHVEKDKARVLSTYGNTYPESISRTIPSQ